MKNRKRLTVEFLERRELLDGTGVPEFGPAGVPNDKIAYGAQGTNWLGVDANDHFGWANNPGVAATLTVLIHKHGNSLTQAKIDRLLAAIAEVNSAHVGSTDVGLQLNALVSKRTNISHHIHLHEASTSGCGSILFGVLGCAEWAYFTASNGTYADGHTSHRYAGENVNGGRAQATLIAGWNWYTGADPAGIAFNQLDYQTVATQELLHLTSLDHDCTVHSTDPEVAANTDQRSVMCGTLDYALVRRLMSTHDQEMLGHIYSLVSGGSAASLGGGISGATSGHGRGPSTQGDAVLVVVESPEASGFSSSDSTEDGANVERPGDDTSTEHRADPEAPLIVATPLDQAGSMSKRATTQERSAEDELESLLGFSPLIDPLVDRLLQIE